MLPPGERVAIGISGGWDSLALTALAVRYNRSVRPRCELIGLHVTLDASGKTAGLDGGIGRWCAELGVPVESIPPRFDAGRSAPAGCFECAHVRRRTLLEAADSRGCRYLALGHHSDDVVETWLMSLMYTGTPEALPPFRSYFGGAIKVVRPLYELKKAEIFRLGRLCGFPEAPTACSEEERTKRARIQECLAALGSDQRLVRRHLFWAAVRQCERELSE